MKNIFQKVLSFFGLIIWTKISHITKNVETRHLAHMLWREPPSSSLVQMQNAPPPHSKLSHETSKNLVLILPCLSWRQTLCNYQSGNRDHFMEFYTKTQHLSQIVLSWNEKNEPIGHFQKGLVQGIELLWMLITFSGLI